MKKLSIIAIITAMTVATVARAHDTATAFPSRGACEAASAQMSNAEQDWLLETFPDLFSSPGEASSFLTKAWTCDRNSSDGQYYVTDHVEEVLGSAWYEHRNH
jgi:hypothetical protein